MLVITRRVDEPLYLFSELPNQKIKVSILAVKGNQVRMGIDAPKSVQVQRFEDRMDYGDYSEKEGLDCE